MEEEKEKMGCPQDTKEQTKKEQEDLLKSSVTAITGNQARIENQSKLSILILGAIAVIMLVKR